MHHQHILKLTGINHPSWYHVPEAGDHAKLKVLRGYFVLYHCPSFAFVFFGFSFRKVNDSQVFMVTEGVELS
jgi:hypothetical protein